jgi:prepilin-type N-terminal cleavage/methylation domain-containing protein
VTRSERGDTLVEVIVSIVVLGIIAAGLLAGMTTTTTSSTISRNQANAEALLTSIGEAVKDPTQFPYACSGSYDVQSVVTQRMVTDPELSGWTATITRFLLWNGTTFVPATPCAGQLQQLTVQVQSPGNQLTWTRDIVKGGDTLTGPPT